MLCDEVCAFCHKLRWLYSDLRTVSHMRQQLHIIQDNTPSSSHSHSSHTYTHLEYTNTADLMCILSYSVQCSRGNVYCLWLHPVHVTSVRSSRKHVISAACGVLTRSFRTSVITTGNNNNNNKFQVIRKWHILNKMHWIHYNINTPKYKYNK